MTPQERVQRLRDGLVQVQPGRWEAGERCVWSDADLVDGVVVSDGPNGDGGVTYLADAEHIARWDPATAAKVLDLVTSVLAEHAPCKTCPGGACHRCDESWPCVNGSFVLAVLDALDGGAS